MYLLIRAQLKAWINKTTSDVRHGSLITSELKPSMKILVWVHLCKLKWPKEPCGDKIRFMRTPETTTLIQYRIIPTALTLLYVAVVSLWSILPIYDRVNPDGWSLWTDPKPYSSPQVLHIIKGDIFLAWAFRYWKSKYLIEQFYTLN